jgi:hypothetical protein
MQLPITANGGRTFPADWHFRTSLYGHFADFTGFLLLTLLAIIF